MASTDQPKPGKDTDDARSDNLLPAEGGTDDGRFDVAEEVNLDQQSDAARHIGHGVPPKQDKDD